MHPRIKLDTRLIGYITTFETYTHAHVKDLFVDDTGVLVFVVKEGDSGKAIGKHGSHIKKLSSLLKKKIKVIEYNADVSAFITNAVHPIQPDAIEVTSTTIRLKLANISARAKLIGRNRRNLNQLDTLTQRYFHLHTKIV